MPNSIERTLVGIVGKSIFYSGSDLDNNNAGFHNSLYRGKNLGTAPTEAQLAAIAAGTFEDLFIGDYWDNGTRIHKIADFDPFWGVGDSGNGIDYHHIAILSDNKAGSWASQWNTSNDTKNGYMDSSAIRTYIKAANGPQSQIVNDFGDSHVKTYRALPATAYSSGNATSWAWNDFRSELLSEMEVYGAPVWSSGGKGYEVGHSKRQLSLFRLRTSEANIRAHWWLRSVNSASNACYVDTDGLASHGSASYSRRVRLLSIIG